MCKILLWSNQTHFLLMRIFYLPSCNGFSDGSIKINLTGGVGPLSYYWLNGTGTADSLYGLTAGIYSFSSF